MHFANWYWVHNSDSIWINLLFILARKQGQDMTKPHYHADIIKLWADGHKIQYRDPTEPNPKWRNDPNPSWSYQVEYRVVPDNVVDLYETVK